MSADGDFTRTVQSIVLKLRNRSDVGSRSHHGAVEVLTMLDQDVLADAWSVFETVAVRFQKDVRWLAARAEINEADEARVRCLWGE